MSRARLAVVLVVSLACACGGVTEREAPIVVPVRRARLTASAPEIHEGVTIVDPACARGAEERCDALDSDCDGRIDEGCEGVEGAPLEIAAAWNLAANVELVLTGPDGEADRVVSRAGCDARERIARASSAEPRPGRYRVELAVADPCGAGGALTASVSIGVEGRVLGTFNRTLAPGERAAIADVELASDPRVSPPD